MVPAMRATNLTVSLACAGLLAAGCLRPFRQRYTEPHGVDFAHAARMAELAAAVYEDAPAVQAACARQGLADVVIRAVPATDDRYFVAVDTATRRTVIALRGTSNLKNIRTDVTYDKKKDDILGVRLHRGFRAAARRVFDEVAPLVPKDHGVELTGHSLGGAEAAVLGAYFKAQGWTVTRVTTFGQPKVTDEAGAKKLADLPLLRVVNVDDPVPLVPPRELKYIDKPYRHFGDEVTLLDGAFYSYLESGNEADAENLAFWLSLESAETFQRNLPQHYITTYISRLAPKAAGTAQEVPYADRLARFTPEPAGPATPR